MQVLADGTLTVDAPAATSTRGLVVLFTGTSFVSAFLLFLVQPMVAKLVLPSYGGSPAVWNTAMVFFQGALLLGYLYAHGVTRRLPPRRQFRLHLVAVAVPLLALPLALPGWAAPPEDRPPALWLLLVLVVAVGGPFVAVSTTGPLLQRWFSMADHERADDPYFLYAASNVGSFLALVAYPFVVEPLLDVRQQTRLWSAGYAAFALLVAGCGAAVRNAPARAASVASVAAAEPLPWRRRLRWLVLAFIPSSLMLGVTSFITTDLAAVPLLWIIPLSIYLLTFVLAFGRKDQSLGRMPAVLAGLAAATAMAILGSVDLPYLGAAGLHVALFAAVGYVAHRRLALDRPSTEHLTAFYLMLALGGVLGGCFNALIAPVVFDRVLEYPLVIAAALLLTVDRVPDGPLARRYGTFGHGLEIAVGIPVVAGVATATVDDSTTAAVVFLVAVGAAGAFAAMRRLAAPLAIGVVAVLLTDAVASGGALLAESRTFFGVYRVVRVDDRLVLAHGSTNHGTQSTDPARRDEPLAYFHRRSPIGGVFEAYGDGAGFDQIGVVGLGVGTLAAYGQADQTFTFYEIDPEVVRLARDAGFFTYLEDTEAGVEIVVGDGRLELAEAREQQFDLLVLDAFSSDSVPVHLLTREAVEGYATRVSRGGLIAFNISNKHLDLRPVLAAVADDLGLAGRVRRDAPVSNADGTVGSWWVVLAADDADLAALDADDRWDRFDGLPRHLWTDAHSDLLSVLGVDRPSEADG